MKSYISPKYPRYKTDDVNVAFRRAAAQGQNEDIRFMEENRAVVDVNGCTVEAGTGMTALHQACKNGKLNAVNCLIAMGADPDIKDNNLKTAYDYADNGSSKEVKQAMSTHSQCKQAWKYAKAIFTEKPGEESEEKFDSLTATLAGIVHNYMNEIKNEFVRIGKKALDNKEMDGSTLEMSYIPTLNQFIVYFQTIASIYHILRTRKDNNFNYAYCDTIAATVFYSLNEKGYKVERFTVINKENGLNHAFVVLNRKEKSDPKDPTTWGPDAYFVNSTGEIYNVANRPKGSLLNLLPNLEVYAQSNEIPKLNGLHHDEAKQFAQNTKDELFGKLNDVMKAITPKEFLEVSKQLTPANNKI